MYAVLPVCSLTPTGFAKSLAGLAEVGILKRRNRFVCAGILVCVESGAPSGGNFDGAAPTAGGAPLTYGRREAGGHVLLDLQCPGCLARIRSTASKAQNAKAA